MSGVDILYVMRVASRRLQTPGVEGVPAGPITAIELDNARAAVEKLIADRAELLEALLAILPWIPTTSANEGGASKYSENVRAADKVRAAIARAMGERE